MATAVQAKIAGQQDIVTGNVRMALEHVAYALEIIKGDGLTPRQIEFTIAARYSTLMQAGLLPTLGHAIAMNIREKNLPAVSLAMHDLNSSPALPTQYLEIDLSDPHDVNFAMAEAIMRIAERDVSFDDAAADMHSAITRFVAEARQGRSDSEAVEYLRFVSSWLGQRPGHPLNVAPGEVEIGTLAGGHTQALDQLADRAVAALEANLNLLPQVRPAMPR